MARALRSAPVVGGAVVVLLVAGGPLARAQLPTFPSTSTTTSSSSTTTSTSPSSQPAPAPAPAPTTTAAPESTTSTAAPASPPPPAGGEAGAGDDGPGQATGVVPPEYRGAIASIRRSPANSTRKLLTALQPLLDVGLTEAEAIAAGFGRFPVAGYATWSHDWWFPRFNPTFHLHQGTDIFAPMGTPVRSPADGVLRQSNGAVGGLAAYVTEPHGTYYYLAHLKGFAPGQVTGQRVRTGDIIGYVGDSGNAKGGSPHVHFEVHPAPTRTVTTGKGKARVTRTVTVPVAPGTQLPPVDPKPILDAWVDEALANVPRVIAAHEAGRPRAIIATGLTRRIGDGRSGDLFSAPGGPSRSQLLWASSASPPGGALRLAQSEAFAAANELGYSSAAQREAMRLEVWRRADEQARMILAPLTPGPLRSSLGL